MIRSIFIIFLSAVSAFAVEPLQWPATPRGLGLGGALVALADDPQTGIVNPAGVLFLKRIGYDLSFATSTADEPDHFSTTFVNPGTEQGSSLGMGFWTQGLSENRDAVYYVPYTGTAWNPAGIASLGLTTRFPYLKSGVDSVESRWEAIGDLALLKAFGHLRFGATVERTFGGSSLVPRLLHAGAAFSSSGITFAYEWRGDETARKFDFHYASSHWGAEIDAGKYASLRAGYISAEFTRLAFGAALGLKPAGWRTQFTWEVPPSGTGPTRWSVGLAYRS
ncbi:hypothetical protein KKH27_07110 [bacterium]|nr:hypothetical protein [bacterium]MBU1985177.1 hypothetical protein [bacterium]